MRVMVVIGTRPEAIKLAPVVRALERHPERITVRVCATGQHREMLDQMLQLFDIQPDVNLDIMQAGQTPSRVAAAVLTGMEMLLECERPDWLLVQGDTTTVMAAAIAAHHVRVRVGHVEAGLRSGDKANPFPEEANRIIADHLSDLCFAPTERARANLLREGIPEHVTVVTGNTVVDALLQVAAQPWQPMADNPLAQLPSNGRLILVTTHRRESFGAPLRRICQALRMLAARGDVTIVYPVHLNPNVDQVVRQELADAPGIVLLPPLDYRSLVHLMQRAYLILTDSGGIQEEAPNLGVPVLVLRNVTERPEAVEAGVARMVGTDAHTIVAEATRLLDDRAAYARMSQAVNLYGDGHAAERIVAALLER
ncbi:MAG: non-hydrolyzing UDP-N-acetylglucosamine 2-epimerase [Anaerolineae bacterium]